MKKYIIYENGSRVYENGWHVGTFEAEDEDDALEALAQEHGYACFADMNEQLGSDVEYDVVEVEA